MRWVRRLAAAPLLGVVACASIWGFQDLTAGSDGGSNDATTGSDAQDDRSESALDAAADAPGEDEDAAFSDAQSDARSPDGGEGGAMSREGGARDAGDAGDDGAAAATCRSICPTGCCDSNNYCQGGSATTVCGSGGAACQSCAGCSALQTACCSDGGCICRLLSIGCP